MSVVLICVFVAFALIGLLLLAMLVRQLTAIAESMKAMNDHVWDLYQLTAGGLAVYSAEWIGMDPRDNPRLKNVPRPYPPGGLDPGESINWDQNPRRCGCGRRLD